MDKNLFKPDELAFGVDQLGQDTQRLLGNGALGPLEEVLEDTNERTAMRLEVTRITDGLGIGEGSISGVGIAESVGRETMDRVDEAIRSPHILVPVDMDGSGRPVDDDGCGDGRFTKLIMRGKELLRKSLNRAKVFGGGATMAASDLIGSGNASGNTLQETFSDGVDSLADNMINYGAHTADHVADGKCGCGAIDEAPTAVSFVAKYRQDITAQFGALDVPDEGLDVVLDNYAHYAAEIAGQPFQGRRVMDKIIDAGKIVKQLGGPHIEARIVLNYVKGTTINQRLVREVSDGKVDVFGVDVWRMQELAKKLHADDEQAEQRAFQSMLAYTLSVAAVLTKGDLPVYTVKAVREEALAQAAV